MKKVLYLIVLLTLPSLAFAQKVQKCNYKFQKELVGEEWSSQKEIDIKFVFNFKNKELERISAEGERKTFRLASVSDATDDQTLEDCKLIFLEYDGEKLKMILYKSEERGLRIIKNDGRIFHLYTR